jgi:putative ABC transport system permease protein
MIHHGFKEVALAFLLVLLSIAIGRLWKIPVGKELFIGSLRSFAQLLAVGYALKYIFDLQYLWMIFLAISIMILVGSHSAWTRIKQLPGSFLIALISISIGSLVTIGIMLLLKLITFNPRYIIPLSGMVIGNSVNASSLTINRIASDISSNKLGIETALSLGKTWREASRRYQKDAIITGMTNMLNFLKTAGIVALPGAMTGMILAGAEPIDAVLLQVIVVYMLLSSVSISSAIALELTIRKFFTSHHQLRTGIYKIK